MIVISATDGGIALKGHAGYAEAGKDIVCAGVTALVQTLITSMEELTADQIEYSISPGKADIRYRNLSEAGRLLVDSFFVGLKEIEREFPEYIRLSCPQRQ